MPCSTSSQVVRGHLQPSRRRPRCRESKRPFFETLVPNGQPVAIPTRESLEPIAGRGCGKRTGGPTAGPRRENRAPEHIARSKLRRSALQLTLRRHEHSRWKEADSAWPAPQQSEDLGQQAAPITAGADAASDARSRQSNASIAAARQWRRRPRQSSPAQESGTASDRLSQFQPARPTAAASTTRIVRFNDLPLRSQKAPDSQPARLPLLKQSPPMLMPWLH